MADNLQENRFSIERSCRAQSFGNDLQLARIEWIFLRSEVLRHSCTFIRGLLVLVTGRTVLRDVFSFSSTTLLSSTRSSFRSTSCKIDGRVPFS